MEILASGKTGADKFDLRTTAPTKIWDRLSARLFAQSMRKFFEVVRGWSYSGDEGAATAINEDLSIITASNIADYESTFTQGLNTLIGFSNTLAVDGTSTANSIVLVPKKISSDVAPDSVNYSTNNPLPLKYQDDLEFTFVANLPNTGAVTISIPSLSGLSGSIDLLDESGNALVGGELFNGKVVKIKTRTISSVKKAILINDVVKRFINSPSFRNVIINGSMQIDQRNAGNSQTITAGAALAYTVDQWYAYCTGANVTGQQVAGISPNRNNYRFTGASSVTKIGFAQRIESANCQHLAGNIATLSVDLANSLLTTVTWVAYYANSGNAFGSLASPTKTQIATGTFTVNSTLTRYSTNITIPSAATTGIEIEFSVAAQTSGTWTIGRVQLEAGSYATPFEQKSLDEILSNCQRYYEKSYNQTVTPGTVTDAGQLMWYGISGSQAMFSGLFKVNKFSTPSITTYSPATGASGKILQSPATDRDATIAGIGQSGFNLYPSTTYSASGITAAHFVASSLIP